MPYADREKQLQHRRAWNSTHRRKSSGYQQSTSKYDKFFDFCESQPYSTWNLGKFANQNSAGVQAWRIKNNFYRDGKWEAGTHGSVVWVCYMGKG